MYIKVVFPIPVNQSYIYHVPNDMENQVDIGKRVNVDFRNHNSVGFIIDIQDQLDLVEQELEIKPVISIVDRYPVFNKQLLKCAKWISDYYFASLGEVLKLMAPGSLKQKEFNFSVYEEKIEKIILTTKQKEIVEDLMQLKLPAAALIYGITGSGKTEIYLNLIEYFIKKKANTVFSS